MNNRIKEFYDRWIDKFILDFLKGNKRTEAAISYVLKTLPNDSKHVLDIGCGIGWSSCEIAKHFPAINIKAVDLSDNLIRCAREIFPADNIKYQNIDITSEYFLEEESHECFDVVVMIDVYEHIPKDMRDVFHNAIDKLLNKKGRVILTCPTVCHQNWLKENKPEELQPVDEMIAMDELQKFATDISGNVIDFQYKNIWREQDYFHALISRGHNKVYYNKKIKLESYKDRINRIKKSKYYYTLRNHRWYYYRFKRNVKHIFNLFNKQ